MVIRFCPALAQPLAVQRQTPRHCRSFLPCARVAARDAAYRHIAAAGRAEPDGLRYIVRMIELGEGLVVLGLIGVAYVTVRMISGGELLAIGIGLLGLVAFVWIRHVVPSASRAYRVGDNARLRDQRSPFLRSSASSLRIFVTESW